MLSGWAAAAAIMAAWGLWTPPVESNRDYPAFGWWMRRDPLLPEEFNLQDGDQKQLRHLILNDPLYFDRNTKKGIAKEAFRARASIPAQTPHPLLGDTLKEMMHLAEKGLKKEFGNHTPSIENQLIVALTLMAAVHSPYFTVREIVDLFGVPQDRLRPQANDATPDFNRWTDEVLLNFPTVYPADSAQCINARNDIVAHCLGVDRVAHFSHFARLAFLLERSLVHGSPNLFRMPNAMKLGILLRPSVHDSVYELVTFVGDRWENKESFDFIMNNLFRLPEIIGNPDRYVLSGDFDRQVKNDKAANFLGAQFACLFPRHDISSDELEKGYALLNDWQVNRTFS